jgi:hypothetical protein
MAQKPTDPTNLDSDTGTMYMNVYAELAVAQNLYFFSRAVMCSLVQKAAFTGNWNYTAMYLPEARI